MFVGVLLTLGIGGFALGQFGPQIWPSDQDGGQNKLFDVSSVEVDSAMSGGDSCLVSPDSILFSPASPGTSISIKRAAQNGFGGFTLSCDNQAGFLDEGASQNRLLMTAQGLDNGGDTFYGASYFGVRTDSVGAYPGNRDNQQFYSALQSVYELSGHVDFTSLPGTTPLDSYYWRGQNVGVDGTSGNNTRPDGISWFTFDTPTLTTLHGFSATGYETVEIRGVPAGGASPAYGLRIYGGSSDLSERVAGTIVLDGLGGSGTRCVQVANDGTMGIAGAACGSGAGTVTAVTATPPIFITGGASPTPNVTEQGSIVSGSTSTTAQNIGAIATAPLGCVTSGGVCTVDGLTLSGGLHFNAGTGAETLDSFSCPGGQAVNASSTSGLACTPFQAPLTACTDYVSVSCQGGTSDIGTGGSNSNVEVLGMRDGSLVDWRSAGGWANGFFLGLSGGNIRALTPTGDHKVMVSATDPTPDYLDTKIESTTGNIAVTHIAGPPEFVNLNFIPGGNSSQTMFWAWNMLTTKALNNQFMCEGGSNTGNETCNQYPSLQTFSNVTWSINVVSNSCTGGGTPTFTVRLEKNGSSVTSKTIACGTTGVVSVGTAAFAVSAGDVIGLVYDGTLFGTGGAGGVEAFVTARFDP